MQRGNVSTLSSPAHIEALEAAIAARGPVEFKVTHRFTPGLYIREIFLPATAILTSAIHRTEHPFVISMGRIRVCSENEGAVEYAAPHTGITLPGTRRILHALEDTVWTTFHATEETDVAKICAEILEPYENPLLPGLVPGYLQNIPNIE